MIEYDAEDEGMKHVEIPQHMGLLWLDMEVDKDKRMRAKAFCGGICDVCSCAILCFVK